MAYCSIVSGKVAKEEKEKILAGKLVGDEILIDGGVLHEFVVCSLTHHLTFIHHYYFICIPYGREAMCDDDGCLTFRYVIDSVHDIPLVLRIQG